MRDETTGRTVPSEADALRRRAEAKARQTGLWPEQRLEVLSREESARLIHGLHVHQIELELQNEELRRAQLELEASRARYFDLYDLAPVGYLTVGEGAAILEANLPAARLLGVERGALVGRALSSFVVADDQDAYHLHRRRLADTGSLQACELRVTRGDGAIVWARLEAEPVRADGAAPRHRVVLTDVTERRTIEETHQFLIRSGVERPGEDFFESLARHLAATLAMDYVCIDRLRGDGLTAETVAVLSDGAIEPNEAYALKDTPCGDVVGKSVCCFPRDVSRLFPRDEALQQLKAESYAGTTLWGFDGKPIGLIAVISRRPMESPRRAETVLALVAPRAAGELERRRAEKAQAASAAKLGEVNRELEEFAHAVSHDLKAPLRAVSSLAGFIASDFGDKVGAEGQAMLALLMDRVRRMHRLIEGVLEYSRLGRVGHSLVPADLGPIVRRAIDAVDPPDGVTVTVEEGLPTVACDPVRMQQVFQNLVGNAATHMGRPRGAIVVGCAACEGGWRFHVRDDGPGIEARHRERIFKIFQPLNAGADAAGTGIGLSIVRRIVEGHGGRIWVEDTPGGGATFFFTLPQVPAG